MKRTVYVAGNSSRAFRHMAALADQAKHRSEQNCSECNHANLEHKKHLGFRQQRNGIVTSQRSRQWFLWKRDKLQLVIE